jgi:hypothetical protein
MNVSRLCVADVMDVSRACVTGLRWMRNGSAMDASRVCVYQQAGRKRDRLCPHLRKLSSTRKRYLANEGRARPSRMPSATSAALAQMRRQPRVAFSSAVCTRKRCVRGRHASGHAAALAGRSVSARRHAGEKSSYTSSSTARLDSLLEALPKKSSTPISCRGASARCSAPTSSANERTRFNHLKRARASVGAAHSTQTAACFGGQETAQTLTIEQTAGRG